MMIYSPAHAIVDIVVAGLLDQQVGFESVTAELSAAIARLGEEKPAALTIETVFASADIPGAVADKLRRMRKHPGLKVEAIISELRRAEGYFVQAHDRYLKRYSDRSFLEMRWAALRLEVVRSFYDGFVKALPKGTKAEVRQAPADPSSIRTMSFGDFNLEEQAALRDFVQDEARTIRKLEEIIKEGRSTGEETRLLIAFLMDDARREQVNRWIKVEARKLFLRDQAQVERDPVAATETMTVSPPVEDTPAFSSAQLAAPGDVPAPRSQSNERAVGRSWPPRDGSTRNDDLAAEQFIEWQGRRSPGFRALLVREASGRISLTAQPFKTQVRELIEQAIDHPAVQAELNALLEETR